MTADFAANYRANLRDRTLARARRLHNLELGRELLAPARLHPLVYFARISDHFAHVGIEAEDAVRQGERFHGVAHDAHATYQIRSAATDHDVNGGGPTLAEVLAQRIRHGTKCLEDVGVVRLASDNEKAVGLLEPV